MKIFVFKPSEQWDYCGGGRVVIASSIEECNTMFGEYRGVMYEKESDIPKEEFCRIWVLVESFDTNLTEKRVVLDDSNWA